MIRHLRSLCLASLAALSAGAAETKPTLVVFKFERVNCRAKDSRFVTKGIYDKASRLLEFTMVDPMSRDEIVDSAGLEVKHDTPNDVMASHLKNAFQADIGIWGKVEKRGQTYTIHARCLDLRKSATKLWLDERYVAQGPRNVRAEVEKIVDALGAKRKMAETFRFKEEKIGGVDTSASRPSLVKNGDFEEGQGDRVAHWWRVNGLTTFWVDGGDGHGKCIKMDTDVLEAEVLPWLKKWRAGAPASQAPKKTVPTKAQQYATIGGTHGVHYKSDPILIKPGMKYRLSFDMKGKWAGMFFPKVWVKGFAEFQDRAGFGDQDREIFRMYQACRTKTAGREWEHFHRTFCPTQALVVLDFEGVDGLDDLAKKIPAAIRKKMRSMDQFPLVTDEMQKTALQKSGFRFTMDQPIAKIVDFANYWLNANLVLYGGVGKEEGRTVACVRGADIRQKQSRPVLSITREVQAPADIESLADEVVKKLATGKRVAKWMRIEAYGYWPRGVYHWDNFRITEEGAIAKAR